MDFLAEIEASDDATVDITTYITADYDYYEIHLLNVIPATDNVSLLLRTSTDGGTSYDAGAADYAWETVIEATGYFDSSDTSIIPAQAVGSDVNETGVSAIFSLINPSAAQYGTVYFHGMYINTSPNLQTFRGCGRRLTAANIDAVRFLFSSGNIESGLFKIYGVR
jgi:hypothetical protein